MQVILTQNTLISAAVLAVCLGCATAADDRAWTGWRGPFHNGSAMEPSQPLTSSKLLWTSEANFPPMAGTRYKFKSEDEQYFFGGYADPVVAYGRVFVYYYRPSGTLASKTPALQKIPQSMKFAADPKRFYAACLMSHADDVLVCLDAKTGKTLWTREFKDKGFNYNLLGSQSYSVQAVPCIGDGKVFVLGSGGRIYGVDALSGDAIWEAELGPATQNMNKWSQTYKETLVVSKNHGEMKKTLCFSPVYAGGYVACSDAKGASRNMGGGPARSGSQCGMVGFNATSGERLWTVPNCVATYSSPLPWTHAGETYFIASNMYAMKCVQASSGQVIWEVPCTLEYSVHDSGMTMAIAGDHIVIQDVTDIEGATLGKDGLPVFKGKFGNGGLSCFQLSLKGPKRIWRHTSGQKNSPGADDKTGTSPIIYKNHVYWYPRRNMTYCLDLQTGKVVSTLPQALGMYGNALAAGDLIFGASKTYKAGSLEAVDGFSNIKKNRYCGPAIAMNCLFVRDNQKVHCYSLTD